jgi:transposase-like protein
MDESDLSVSKDQFAGVRRQYTTLDKAKAYWQLQANGNNLKRTCREMGIPVPTLRSWRKKWDVGEDIPPVLPVEENPYDLENFDHVGALKDLRKQAILRIAEQILHTNSLDHLTKLLATIDRDLDRIENKPAMNSGSVNINVRLPSAEETAKLLSGLVENTISDIDKRHGEIIDMEADEITEKPMLTPLKDLGMHTHALSPEADKE